MKVFEIQEGSSALDGLRQFERPKPEAGPYEVLVRVRAASLNFRDLAIVSGKYFGGPVAHDTIPLSDGAGEVEAIGDGVTDLAVGDRVMATFWQGDSRYTLGSPRDGMLTEYAVFNQDGLVPIPENLSFEEAATLPCAGVTAWNALTGSKVVRPGDTVLTLGTGGVSIFVLQLGKAAGARVIITSSSDEKLARAAKLGADDGINYKTTPDWEEAVLGLTDGRGADHVVDLGGPGTLPHSYLAVSNGGEISMIGVITRPDGDLNPLPLMTKSATLRGIFVGPKPLLEGLCRALAVNAIQPVIDSVFEFDQSAEAYKYLKSAQHFGKVVIRIG